MAALDRVPPGFSHDEAYNGVTAIQVLEGQHLIFFEINKGIEPLIIYLEALAFGAFGIGPVPMRLVNVICGMLTVALVYPLGMRLFNRRVALLAMAGLAVSFWAVFVSRLTLRAVTLPPLLMLTLYFVWRGLAVPCEAGRPAVRAGGWLALAGLAAGVAMYTYLSARFIPLLILGVFGYQLVRGRVGRWHWPGFIALWLLWAALFTPLALYYLEHAESFARRADQVSTIPYLLDGDVRPLLENTFLTLGMFTFYGDETDRYNLDGRPVFDPVNGLFFYLGLAIILLRLRRGPPIAGPAALLLLWAFFMLLPDFITDDSPHFLRTIGALPAVSLFWAIGLAAAERAGKPIGRPLPRMSGRLVSALAPLLLVLTALHTSYDYFGRWAASPEARAIYGADIAGVADYVKRRQGQNLVVISAEYYQDLDPFRFRLHFQGRPPFVLWFDGRQTLAFPPPGSGLSPHYVFPASAPPAGAWLSFLEPLPTDPGQEFSLYGLPETAAGHETAIPLENQLEANVNGDLALWGYQIMGTPVSGGKFQILLGWQALRTLPPGTDYTFLVRFKDSQGHTWAWADDNGYAPADWQPGVVGLQLLTLRLPGDLPPRVYDLTAEVVDRRAGRPLPVLPAGQTEVALTSLPAQLAATPRVIDLADLPNPLPAPSVGKPITPALRGYEVAETTVAAGESLEVTLHWQVIQPPRRDYQLGFYLSKQSGPVYRWPPVEPVGGEWPTQQWPADYWVQDRLDLPVGPEIPAGPLELWVTWLDRKTGQPLGLADNDSPWNLGTLTVKQQAP